MTTDVEAEVIQEFIREHKKAQRKSGRKYILPPSVREIADHLGVSVPVAHKRLTRSPGLVREKVGGSLRWDVIDDG